MPYVREGNCVYHQDEDGSRGELIKCHDTVEEAQAHLEALYANVEDARKEDTSPQVQECVSQRVGAYIEEGLSREQALARAFGECRDEAGGKQLGLVEQNGEIYLALDPDCPQPVLFKLADLQERLVAFGGGVKALDAHEGRVGGYLVMWGDYAKRDLEGEFFTPETDLGLDWFPKRPVLYHHGLDKRLRHAKIGDIVALSSDDVGLWVEAQLDLRNRYVRAVLELIQKGAVGWSSGTLPHLVEVKNGRIAVWPIVEGSITPTPAEPRTVVVPLKALVVSEGNMTAGQTTPALTPAVDSPLAKPSSSNASVLPDGQHHKGATAMDAREIALAAINATLEALNVTDVSEEDKMKLVESVLAHLANAGEPTPPNEEKARELGEQIGKAATEAILAYLTNRAAIETATATARKAREEVTPEPAIATRFQSNRAPIEVRTRWHHLSSADMAFLISLQQSRYGKAWQPPQEFMRELADKALRREAPYTTYHDLEVDPRDGQPYALKALRQIAAEGGYKANEVMGPTQTGFGAEWVPDLWSNELWRTARFDNPVLGLLEQIDMPQDDWVLPIDGTDPTIYRVPITADDTQLNPASSPVAPSKFSTGNVLLSAKKIGARVPFAREIEEDSIIRFVPELRRKMQQQMMAAIDYCILHADNTTGTGNINKHDATVNAADLDVWLLGFEGICHIPLVDNTANSYNQANNRPDVDMMRGIRRLLDPRLLNKMGELVYVVEPVTATYLLDMPEVLTVDKFGQRATILSGQLAAFDSIPLVVSGQLLQANTNGMISNTPGNNIYGRVLIFHRPSFRFGYRRRVTLELVQLPLADAAELVAFARIALARQSTDSAALAYHIAL